MGNTEGSLSEAQKAIIVGCILGDGYMRIKTNAHLEINHSYAQKEYVDWKYRNLQKLVRSRPVKRKGNGDRVAYRFTTRSVPSITYFYNLFYKDRKKIIPDNLTLRPLTLAVWFMDDGSRCGKQLYLNTQQFSKHDQCYLTKQLEKQWNITSNINKDKNYYRIRIFAESNDLFLKIIRQYLLPCFSYKLLI